jgi:HTH-type transcriptional regulator/antitoxin HigA
MSNRKLVSVPPHAYPPTDLLREEIEYRRLSVEQLAAAMGWEVGDTRALVAGDVDMTQAAAVALELALGVDAGLWMHLQTGYEKDRAALDAFTRDRENGER